ncbi:MAG: SMI1/KNR4 family protein [Myxococcales bacterium]|nr:SMI1/KNR4 family protein [Myxococcales bacterium]
MKVPTSLTTNPPASTAALDTASQALHRPLPNILRVFLGTTNGLSSDDGVVLYSCEDIVERNKTFEVARYAGSWVAVGDDSGGRVLLLSAAGDGVWVDSGSMDPEAGISLSHTFSDWIEAGVPLDDSAPEYPNTVDVYLEAVPTDGLRGLVRVKQELALQQSPAELKALVAQVPVRLQRDVPYGQALVRCRRLNAADACVGLRYVDDPGRRVPDTLG